MRITGFKNILISEGFPDGSAVKNTPANEGDEGWIPGLGRTTGEGSGNLLQCSCLENPKDKGAWRATVYGVTKVEHDLATKQQQQTFGYILMTNVSSTYMIGTSSTVLSMLCTCTHEALTWALRIGVITMTTPATAGMAVQPCL